MSRGSPRDPEPPRAAPRLEAPFLGVWEKPRGETSGGKGARGFICDNGVMLGEIEAVKRKHTTGLDLDALVKDALGEYLERLPGFGRMHDELANSRLTDMRAKALIHDAFPEEKVMACKYLPAVSETYFRSDQHRRRFPGRNRWTLYNAFTETFKKEPVTLQPGSFCALTRALCPRAN